VLLPVQIAFLELIIDPACSVVFEAEQIDPDVMNRPPRPISEPMFGRRVLTIAALQGLSLLAAIVAVYVWAVDTTPDGSSVRSVTFVALVLGNLALILVNRSWRLPVWRTFAERSNPTIGWILLLAVGVLVLLLTVPALRHLFGFGPITPADALVATAAAVLGVAWFEVYKVVLARRSVPRPG
jgi:P-type Ca2+ transporter type 2C